MMMKSVLVPRRTRRSAVPALRGVPGFEDLVDQLFRGVGVAPAWSEAGVLGEFTPRIDVRRV